jgi:RNA polymerase sigma-70 factor (ECF subfamily)
MTMAGTGAGAEASETALLRSVLAGDPDAVERLVDNYWDDAYRVAYLALADQGDAEEAAQDALLNAIRALPSFDLDRPFRPWLRRIAVNRSYDAIRRRNRGVAEVPIEEIAEFADDGEELADALSREADRAGLLRHLEALPDDFRVPIVLRHLLGYSAPEIAEVVGVPATTVRTRIHRGLAQLREAMDSPGEGRTG